LRTVDSGGTDDESDSPQKRRRCSESDTSRTSVSYPQPKRCSSTISRTNTDIANVGRPLITRRCLPPLGDRLQQPRIPQEPIQPLQTRRQPPHLDRQHLIKQRLDLLANQPQHHATTSETPSSQDKSSIRGRTDPHQFRGK
jgi:hypothetical protein